MLENWNEFYRRVLIAKPTHEVFDMWISSKAITSWFLKSAEYIDSSGAKRSPESRIEPGDTYTWKWHNWDGSSSGKILELDPNGFLKFEFASSIVDLRVETFTDGRTLLTLRQHNIPTDDDHKMNVYCGCSSGWTFWLTNLKAYLELGILLNESGNDLNGVFEGYQIVNT